MLKLAGLIIDAYDDPDFVSHPRASELFLTPEQVGDLKDRDFAIIIKTASGSHRKYPLATANLVKLASAYFNDYGYQLPVSMRNAARSEIQSAAERFHVKLAGESAKTTDDSGVRTFDATGETIRETSDTISKEAAVRIVEQEIINNFSRMSPTELVLAVSDLAKVAEISDHRLKPYEPRDTFGSNLLSGLTQRESLLQEDTIKLAEFEALLSRFPKIGAKSAAVMLDQFDKRANLVGRVPDAYMTCWGGFHKSAEHSTVGHICPERYKIETLAKSYSEVITSVFSEEVATAFLRNPVSYYENTASAPVKKVLKRLAKMVGKDTEPNGIKEHTGKWVTEMIR